MGSNLQKMPPKIQKSKEAKARAAMSSGKGKKKKWSKGKVRDKLVNLSLFDQATFEKFNKEVPGYKIVTASIASERMKIKASLAKRGLRRLAQEGKSEQSLSTHPKWSTQKLKNKLSLYLPTNLEKFH